MAITGLAQLPASFSDLLNPGEQPLAWETVALWGENRIGLTEKPKVIRGINLNPASALGPGPIDVDPGLFERLLAGIALTGGAGSTADRLGRALTRIGQARLAVTTQRLLLVEEGDLVFTDSPTTGRRVADQATTTLWATARTDVADVALRSRVLMAGRLAIGFTDASTATLMCGVLSPRPAHRLRHALLSTDTEPDH